MTYLVTREAGSESTCSAWIPRRPSLSRSISWNSVWETLSRGMFATNPGVDLLMRMNLSAWQSTRDFVGSPEALNYDHVMGNSKRSIETGLALAPGYVSTASAMIQQNPARPCRIDTSKPFADGRRAIT